MTLIAYIEGQHSDIYCQYWKSIMHMTWATYFQHW